MIMQKMEHFLCARELTQELVRQLDRHFPDFCEVHRQYDAALAVLREDSTLPVEQEVEAIEQQTASLLLFSGALGLEANLDNFYHPTYGSFLDTDPEVYLREHIARSMPEFQHAQKLRDGFFARLKPAQRGVYEDITAYACYLETAGPKLAHYYGYCAGNTLLPRCVPGYRADNAQTLYYHQMLQSYFGHSFDETFDR